MAGKDAGGSEANRQVEHEDAGAVGLACAKHYLRLGVQREHILTVDTKGLLYKAERKA
jgi:malate dehydrogenase (oxaloacetate-decarboxylating)(NADP+)